MTDETLLKIDADWREMKRRVRRREKFQRWKDVLAILLVLSGVLLGWYLAWDGILLVGGSLVALALYIDRT